MNSCEYVASFLSNWKIFITRENYCSFKVLRFYFIKVIDGEGNWWACENKYGYAGYVPKNILQQATQEIFQEPSNPRMPYNMMTDMPSKAGWRQSTQNH